LVFSPNLSLSYDQFTERTFIQSRLHPPQKANY
jgi:hypothetical protein